MGMLEARTTVAGNTPCNRNFAAIVAVK